MGCNCNPYGESLLQLQAPERPGPSRSRAGRGPARSCPPSALGSARAAFLKHTHTHTHTQRHWHTQAGNPSKVCVCVLACVCACVGARVCACACACVCDGEGGRTVKGVDGHARAGREPEDRLGVRRLVRVRRQHVVQPLVPAVAARVYVVYISFIYRLYIVYISFIYRLYMVFSPSCLRGRGVTLDVAARLVQNERRGRQRRTKRTKMMRG